MENKYTEQDLIDACKYGYDYHKTSKFPNLEFEQMAINNFKQVLSGRADQELLVRLKSKETPKIKEITAGVRIIIPVVALEFNAESHTIWVQSNEGATTLRIKCTGKINVDTCQNSPLSHSDIMVQGDIDFCVSNDAEIGTV